MRIPFLIFTLLCLAQTVYSQSSTVVEGSVLDTAGLPMNHVMIRLLSVEDSLTGITNANGIFHFEQVQARSFRIKTHYLGVSAESPLFSIDSNHKGIFTLQPITLKTISNQLAEVIVRIDPVKVKEDTIEYDAAAYKLKPSAMTEDLLKKLPGITVDAKGTVTAQGKEVTKIKVNGKDFFGGDVLTATKNLPADVISNIQVIDDYGEQAKYTRIKSGEPEKVININIKKSKNRGGFGNVSAGVGTNDRYQFSTSLNNFKDDLQVSLIGGVNNTNTNGLNRGSGFGSAGDNGQSMNQSAMLNIRNKWGKKWSFYSNYYFTRRESITSSTNYTQDFNPLNTRITDQNSNGQSQNIAHSGEINLEYDPDTLNHFNINPSFNYTTYGAENSNASRLYRPGFFTSNTGRSSGDNTNASMSIRGSYNHRFRKPGRNLQVNGTISYNSSDQERAVNNAYYNIDSAGTDTLHPAPVFSTTRQQQSIGDNNNNIRTSANLSYTEPLSKSLFLELNMNWNGNSNRNNHIVYDIDSQTNEAVLNPRQTNLFRYYFNTQRYGFNLRKVAEKYNYTIGMVVQPSQLEGNTEGKNIHTEYRFINWMPAARFVYNFTKSSSLSVNYSGSSREPGYAQLQPVVDSSNLTNIVIGNPDLKAEFTNRVYVNFNRYDKQSGTTLYMNVSVDQTQNKIVNNTFNAVEGTGITTTYRNTDGFYRLFANASFTRPFAKKKYNVTISANSTYSNNISYTDNLRNNGYTWNIRPAARFYIDISEVIDAEFNTAYSVNKTLTRYTGNSVTTRTQTLSLGISGKNYFFKDWTLGYDYTKNFNYGFGSSVQSNPDLLHLYVEYAFLKKKTAALRLQAFDVFNENTGINRSVNGTTVTDSRNMRLGRYFLLVFNLKIQQFKAAKPSSDDKNKS